ncbi:MAG: murein biosynthesis integral membrane protein MurJ [Deltaproteobacteria bacterium]|nr:murein biosynthesis integral membrane protein MurJ [Deltaproteobacteria bacterium]
MAEGNQSDPSPPPGAAPSTRGHLAVAFGILLSRIAGFARERAIAHYLGNTDASGAFRAALRIPNLLQNLFGEGVLSASFIPVYARLVSQDRHDDARRVASAVASLLLGATAVLVLLGVSFAPELTTLLAPGFSGPTRMLTIRITRVLFPGAGILVLSAWCLGVLNSHRRLFLSYAAPVVWNVAMIATLVVFAGPLVGAPLAGGSLAVRLAWGAVVGSALQLAIQLPSALRLARGFRPSLGRRDPEVSRVLSSFGPVVVARGVVQISAYVDQLLASFLGAATVSAIGFAQTIALLPVSLFGMSVSAAELPEMSRLTGSGGDVAKELHARLGPAMRRIGFLVAPSTVAMLLLGRDLVGALFQTGTFGAQDTRAVAWILVGASVGLLAVTRARLYSSALYALGETRAPLRFALGRVALSAALGVVATFPAQSALGYGPTTAASLIVASSGVAGWLELLLLRAALSSRIGPPPSTWRGDARIWAVALVAGGAAAAIAWALPVDRPLLHALATLPAFGGTYLVLAHLAGVPDARALAARVTRRR